MLQISDAQMTAWLAAWFFPFCRIAAMIGTAPILGDTMVPARIKIALAVLITILVAPGIDVPAVTILSGDGLLLIARQFMIGAAMGLGIRLAFAALQFGGDLIGLQMGLGFAQSFDPQHNQESPVVGNLISYLASLIFLAVNGHLLLIGGITASFQSMPVFDPHPFAMDWSALVVQGGAVFSMGLYIALPVVAAILLANLALGVMMRSAPQLNLFSVGFPITLLMGMVALLLDLPAMLPMTERVLIDATSRLIG
jgi:flagellar biosynthetic protein FliR